MRQTVLIVDDHPEFRKSARALLEDEGFVVVGEARDGREAVSLAARLHPEIVLLDIQLPDLDGFAVAERLSAGAVPPMVVFISSRSAASFGPRLDDAAARGFIPKSHLSGAALSALVG